MQVITIIRKEVKMNAFLITGATGYIGSMTAKKLISIGEKVTVIVRETSRLDADILSGAEVITADITNQEAIFQITEKYDYVIHCAAPTKSAYMISNPVEVADTIVNGTKHILNLAERCRAKSMVYLSSMEVYGKIHCSEGKRVTEEHLGYIDVTNVRSCYPLAKIMAENLCHSYLKEYGVPVKIARLAQTFGRGIRQNDTRVFAQFASAVKNDTDIVLHTTGNSTGNYCDIDDAVDGILFILTNGQNGQAYNIVNEANTMTIKEMAEMVADKIADGKIKVTYDIPESNQYGYAEDTGLRLSGEKLRNLGFEANINLEDIYRSMLN